MFDVLTTQSPMPPHPVGEALFRKAAAVSGSRRCVMAFSNGKDAVAAWLALRDRFEVVAYYMELVPGLSFIEESLTYYERFFGTAIVRVPHPSVLRMVNQAVYQSPARLPLLDELAIKVRAYETINDDMKKRHGWDKKVLTATGLRIQDSLMRRTNIRSHGPIALGVRKWYPVWDWSMDHMVRAFRHANVKLPVDYRIFGRSFDGLAGYYLLPIRKHFPSDYRKIVELYPMIEAEVVRYERWAA